jgi:hypothetical protein
VRSVTHNNGDSRPESRSVVKPSPARGRCPPELGRGGWSKRASPGDRQGQGFESGRIQYTVRTKIRRGRLASVRYETGSYAVLAPRAGGISPGLTYTVESGDGGRWLKGARA